MTTPAAVPAAETELSASERERVYRRNFVMFLADYVIFSLGMSLIGPSTVIPDFVRKLTDWEVLIAVSSQMFEFGWLLPQLLVARRLVRVANKKWWFVGPNIPVRTLMLTFAGIVVLLGPERRSAMLALFVVFYGLAALGDGLVGVPWMDLVGSSLDDRRRARMFGLGNALVGVAILALAPLVRVILGDSGPDFPNNYALLFGLAGVLFLSTVPVTLLIHELPGSRAQANSPSLREYLPDLMRVLRQDRPYRAMLVARVLVSLFTLAAPFYIGYATEQLGVSSDVAVSNLLAMQTVGSVAGALAFSWWGERNSLPFIRAALAVALLQPTLALLAGVAGPALLYVAFLVAGVAWGNLGVGFLNWVIVYATPQQRPVYAGLFNSVSALGLLAAPIVGGLLVELFGYQAAFGAALLVMAGALTVAVRYVRPPVAEARAVRRGA